MADHRTLSKSYRGRFPFKIAATSFIYPDLWDENVKMLAPFVDEIELLFFESRYPESLPNEKQIHRIKSAAKTYQTTFNVHLPLDISLGDRDKKKRRAATDTVNRVLNLTAPLSPSTYTIHLTFEQKEDTEDGIRAWRERVTQSLEEILASGISPNRFSVENLDYPFSRASEIIHNLDLHVCLDMGHLIRRKESFLDTFHQFKDRIDILHIQGTNEKQDHAGLEILPEKELEHLWQMLRSFSGIVSVEVFSLARLESSLALLDKHRHKFGG